MILIFKHGYLFDQFIIEGPISGHLNFREL